MYTVTVQIGNTDNKLTQQEWSEYATNVVALVKHLAVETHFCGASEGTLPWQNLCIVVATMRADDMRAKLKAVAKTFKQDSVAFTVGKTEMIET